jgi:hypothetical protein
VPLNVGNVEIKDCLAVHDGSIVDDDGWMTDLNKRGKCGVKWATRRWAQGRT